MSPSIRRRAAALAVLAAVTLAACGDDSEPTAASTDAPPAAPSDTAAASDTEAPPDTVADGPGAAEPSAAPTSAPGAAPAEITVATYHGGEVAVPFDPESVVVLDFAALDTIDHLGLGDRVVGIPSGTAVPPYLASYADRAANVGTLFEPDFEAINALEPDLIVAGGRSQPVVGELAEIAPTIDVTFEWGSEPFLESLTVNTTALGQIFGVDDVVATALGDLDAEAAAVAERAADAGTGLVVLTSAGEVAAYGPDPAGRYDLVYEVFGIQPAAEQVAIDTHGDAISFEFLAETDPDMLIVLDRDAAIGEPGDSAQQILDNDLVNGTSAAQAGKVLYVDTAKWYLSFGGLTSYATMIDEVGSLVE